MSALHESGLTIHERVAVLETKVAAIETLLAKIDSKLDELVQLKAKGMGAVGLVSLIVGSGVLGLVFTLWNMFQSRSHI